MTTADARPHGSALVVVEAFQEAFGDHDVDRIMGLMTEDCVFESTDPPDGRRYEGRPAVRTCWETLFRASQQAAFETEEAIVAGPRVVVRWRYSWGDGHVRGIDLFRVRDDRVAEKLSYVKG